MDTDNRKKASEQHKSLFGLFAERADLEIAIRELKNHQFFANDISVLMSSTGETKQFALENSTKAPEASMISAISGAALGGALGWLAGVGMLAIPGVGPLVAAGPIMAALAGTTLGGAFGGVAGALVGLGIPEYEAKRFESSINQGGILISVKVTDAASEALAKDILNRCGATDISVKTDQTASAPRRKPDDFDKRPYRDDMVHISRQIDELNMPPPERGVPLI